VALFAAALSPRDELTVVESAGELAANLQERPDADAVMLDLPAPVRRELCDQVRQRYRGRLLVAADQQAETQGWPADHARRFLIRPFPVTELSRALRMPIAPAAAPPPEAAQPPEGVTATEAEAGAEPPPRRLSSDEPLWGTPSPTPGRTPGRAPVASAPARAGAGAAPAATATTAPSPGPTLRLRGARQVSLLVAALLVLLAGVGIGGVAIGRATAKAAPVEAIATTPSAPPSSLVNRSPARTPPACDAALNDADAAISYLIAHITDQRLSKALDQFQTDRRACRQVK
jgi:hypothetical protein